MIDQRPGWWIALLGWPAISAAATAFALAVFRRSPAAAVTGCVLAAPMMLYLSLTPLFYWAAPVSYLALCVLAWRVRRWPRGVSVTLLLPAAAVLLWLAVAVLNP
ncbi:MAG: hypothetical protein ACE5G3_01430 [Gammaproteobacteria bacterium]